MSKGMEIQLTKEEKAAIAALKRVAKKWPKSLWLFSANGTLCVMRYKLGTRAVVRLKGSSGTDPDYIVNLIQGIDNDGVDW